MKPLAILLASAAAAMPATAAVYSVRQDGLGDFTTVQACADAARAGDTCRVVAGVYDEVVLPRVAGSSGNPLTFEGEPGATVAGFRIVGVGFIRLLGFTVTHLPSSRAEAAVFLHGAHGSELVGLDIHDVAGVGIWLHHGSPSNGVRIRDNRIRFTGCTPGNYVGEGGLVVHGSDLLIEGNDISHVGDFSNTWGNRIVLRNNVFHDVYNEDFPQYFDLPTHDPLGHHVDAVQHYASLHPLHFLLFEDNVVRDVPLANVHGGIFQDQDGTVSDSDVIYRHNVFAELGGAMVILNPFRDFRAVGNTIAHGNRHPPGGNTTFSASSSVGPCSGIQLLNNIFWDSTRAVAWAEPYSVDAGSRAGFAADHNLAYRSGTPDPLEANGLVGVDAGFAGASAGDYTLAPGSPAIDAGGAPTRVVASDPGSGTVLAVEDARFFQDGWAGVQPDTIAVGAVTSSARAVAIDYGAGLITLDRDLARAPGDAVWLLRNSSGRLVLRGAAPDIGALEHVAGLAPVRDLRATRAGAAVALVWASTPGAAGYNVWVVSEKQNIPIARQHRAPHARGVAGCAIPLPSTTNRCDDTGARAPGLAFYQVRAQLDPDTEGP